MPISHVPKICHLLSVSSYIDQILPSFVFLYQRFVLDKLTSAVHIHNNYYHFYFYLWDRCGAKCTITAAIYWPVVPALDDRW
jgi:hypothetical protein